MEGPSKTIAAGSAWSQVLPNPNKARHYSGGPIKTQYLPLLAIGPALFGGFEPAAPSSGNSKL